MSAHRAYLGDAMAEEMKIGIVGAGFIGAIQIEAIRRIPGATVTAVAGSDIGRIAASAARLGITRYYDDYRDMLKDRNVDVVHICSPNNLHFQMVMDVLKSGRPVLCEKPLATNANEAKQMVEFADQKSLPNAVHFNVRYYPVNREAYSRVAGGQIGRIYSIHGSYLQDWLFYDTDYSWRLEPELSGRSRAIGDIGSHWLDLVEYVCGVRVKEVNADFATFHKTRKKPKYAVETWSGKLIENREYSQVAIDTEDYASVLFRCEGDVHGAFTVSQMAAGRKNRVYYEIDGSERSVIWDSERPNELTLGRRDGPNELLFRDPALMGQDARAIASYPGGHNEGFADTCKQLFTEFYRDIQSSSGRSGAKPRYPTFADGLRQVQLCDAILESAASREWKSI